MVQETRDAEKFAIPIIAKAFKEDEDSIFHASLRDPKNPFDLILKGKRFDVKYANPTLTSNQKKQRVWDFDLRGKKNYCDYLVLIGINHFRPVVLLLVPAIDIPTHHIRVSIKGDSKWNQYIIWRKE